MADELLKKLQEFKGFASVRSDYYHSTPQPQDRHQPRSRRDLRRFFLLSAIQSLMRNAYSQNYIYLIKQPDDQYQVILEVKDKERAHPDDLDDLYVRSSNTSGNFQRERIGWGEPSPRPRVTWQASFRFVLLHQPRKLLARRQ